MGAPGKKAVMEPKNTVACLTRNVGLPIAASSTATAPRSTMVASQQKMLIVVRVHGARRKASAQPSAMTVRRRKTPIVVQVTCAKKRGNA